LAAPCAHPFVADEVFDRKEGTPVPRESARHSDNPANPMSEMGLVSRVSPVHTAIRNCTRDEGGPFEVGNQVLISSRRKLLSSKAMVVNVAEKPEQDSGRHD
jgi:hypothetical protein